MGVVTLTLTSAQAFALLRLVEEAWPAGGGHLSDYMDEDQVGVTEEAVAALRAVTATASETKAPGEATDRTA